MIRSEKLSNALYALSDVLVRARIMAFEHASHDMIATVLDVAELLPTLIARKDDATAEFRQHLEGLLEIDAGFGIALHRFDEEAD